MSAACLASCVAGSAAAGPATQEGADKLRHSIESRSDPRLFTRGLFRIVPIGDHYDFIVDTAVLPGERGRPFPKMTLHLSPADDGTYRFTSDTLSYTAAKSESAAPAIERLENCGARGVFNPTRLFLSTLELTCARVALTNDALDPKHYDIRGGSLTWQGKAAADDTADIVFELKDSSLVEDFIDESGPVPSISARLQTGEAHYKMSLFQAKAGQIAELYKTVHVTTMGAPHPTFDVLKKKISDALPLWSAFKFESTVQDSRLSLSDLTAKVPSYAFTQTLSGVAPRSGGEATLVMAGASLFPNGQSDRPIALFPSDADVKLSMANVDLAGWVGTFLQQETEEEAAMWLDTSGLAFLLNGSGSLASNLSIRAPLYDVQGSGSARLDTAMRASATLSAGGFDAALRALNTAKVPPKIALVLAMMKGMAKPTPDGRLSWDISLDLPASRLSVNGQSLDLSGR
ncbi:hypothetical protein [Labrys monachus]|uniref:DUF2125 domain-containing protein n=1 Tax=Labrys monachus TaxID=217067 RepID=A0ABU0FKD3_9HYPH|nr:hypothetical protein [Labrys monachus]MDQ0395059.1 hypothetical protein [Labrys monachus]